jgi:hypothetical protein
MARPDDLKRVDRFVKLPDSAQRVRSCQTVIFGKNRTGSNSTRFEGALEENDPGNPVSCRLRETGVMNGLGSPQGMEFSNQMTAFGIICIVAAVRIGPNP